MYVSIEAFDVICGGRRNIPVSGRPQGLLMSLYSLSETILMENMPLFCGAWGFGVGDGGRHSGKEDRW